MVTSFISLGVRAGTVVALSIPLTIAIVFPIMEFLGIDLQRISLGALIIALGLLVDDAMTTIDVMISRLAAGDSKPQAAAFAYREPGLSNANGFLHHGGGVRADRLRPQLGGRIHILDLRRRRHHPHDLLGRRRRLRALAGRGDSRQSRRRPRPTSRSVVIRGFRGFLLAAMRMRWLTIGITLACFVVSLLAVPLVPRQFFPPSDRPDLMVDLRLPQNASIYASDEVAARVDKLLAGDPDVAHWTTYVGRGAIRFYLPLDVQLANDFFAQVVDRRQGRGRARAAASAQLEAALAENFPGVVSRVSPLGLGPPVGWPVQYRVSGPDINEVRDIALRLAGIVSARTTACAGSISTGWSRPGRCGSASTRTRHGCSA